jgi:Lrp/AsnC family leucine-responsive transcriptional regulator
MPNQPIDAIDRKILTRLQSDARTTNQDLSEVVGLSPSPCLRRVRHLEEAGIITGYVALVSPEAVGLPVSAFVRVRLSSQDDRNLAEFEAAIVTFSEVMECYLMTGDSDYQLRALRASPRWRASPPASHCGLSSTARRCRSEMRIWAAPAR